MFNIRSVIVIGLLLIFSLSACDVLSGDPTVTPIFVTATPAFIIVTNTPSPSPSPVLAPTIDRGGNNATPIEGTNVNTEPTQPPPATATATTLITLTPTFTPTPTNTRSIEGVSAFQPVGIAPGDAIEGTVDSPFLPPGQCVTTPAGGFATVYSNNPELASQLGCATTSATPVASAYQSFERGLMIWVSSQASPPQSAIYALSTASSYQAFSDTWREGVDPNSSGAQPPSPGLIEPIRGFGKVWREGGGVQSSLGWATSPESGGSATIQQFDRGTMIYLTQTGQTYILIAGAPGTWSSVSIAY
ncbi:MAG: hypothetical protein L0154_10960 [Chloroflexi bacterium]|nr:hypothetical protein [Chloroflexota bacterium]